MGYTAQLVKKQKAEALGAGQGTTAGVMGAYHLRICVFSAQM
jgi:hypothetical protein